MRHPVETLEFALDTVLAQLRKSSPYHQGASREAAQRMVLEEHPLIVAAVMRGYIDLYIHRHLEALSDLEVADGERAA